jgi:2-polyprenyl-3-methyl-5-hydroxy-6-metoxy-1,4-benzoquinol methylase
VVNNTVQSLPQKAIERALNLHFDDNCIICGAHAPGEQIGGVVEHEYTTTTSMTFPIMRCPNCRLVYLYPRPDVSELDTIYPSEYYSYHLSLNAADKATGKKSFVQSLFYKMTAEGLRAKIVPNLKNVPLNRPLRVLDIGCGVGAQLDLMKDILGNCDCFGVEIGEIAVNQARERGHHVYHGRFEEVDLPIGYFDVIISIHVIEHVDRPDLFLKKAAELLTDDGIILIETPNTDCVDFKLFKSKHWGGYHAPRHWYLFETSTFRNLAKRLNLDIVNSAPYTSSVFWNWTCHSLILSIAGRKLADRLFPPVTIFYGGLQSFLILSLFAVFERALLALTGKASALWIVFAKSK